VAVSTETRRCRYFAVCVCSNWDGRGSLRRAALVWVTYVLPSFDVDGCSRRVSIGLWETIVPTDVCRMDLKRVDVLQGYEKRGVGIELDISTDGYSRVSS